MIKRDFSDMLPARPCRIAAASQPADLHFQIVFFDGRPHRFGLPVADLEATPSSVVLRDRRISLPLTRIREK
jgi:hypothetical protein